MSIDPQVMSPIPWQNDIQAALADFVTVARMAGYDFTAGEMRTEYFDAPHRAPRDLPDGSMALYAFRGPGGWLKIGIAGKLSQSRYTSQHYNVRSARSTLAASLTKDPAMATCIDFNPDAPGDWIRTNCRRVNVVIDAEHGRPLLALLEAFLHARLRPRYER